MVVVWEWLLLFLVSSFPFLPPFVLSYFHVPKESKKHILLRHQISTTFAVSLFFWLFPFCVFHTIHTHCFKFFSASFSFALFSLSHSLVTSDPSRGLCATVLQRWRPRSCRHRRRRRPRPRPVLPRHRRVRRAPRHRGPRSQALRARQRTRVRMPQSQLHRPRRDTCASRRTRRAPTSSRCSPRRRSRASAAPPRATAPAPAVPGASSRSRPLWPLLPLLRRL